MEGLFQNIGDVGVFLTGKPDLIQMWYKGGFVVAFAIALFAVAWIFYDSVRTGLEATIWKVISVVSVILAVPSLVLWLYPSLAAPVATTTIYGAVDALAYLGIAAGIGGLVSIVGYALGIGEPGPARTCPNCGQRWDASWEYCPHCSVPETETYSEPSTDLPVVAPTEPLDRGVAFQPVDSDLDITRPIKVRKGPLAFLVQTSGMRRGHTHHLGEITNIGRDATENDIVVEEDIAGRRHARVKLEDGEFVLYDLASANGTLVNGQEIVKQALEEHDKVKIGETTFSFMRVKEENEA